MADEPDLSKWEKSAEPDLSKWLKPPVTGSASPASASVSVPPAEPPAAGGAAPPVKRTPTPPIGGDPGTVQWETPEQNAARMAASKQASQPPGPIGSIVEGAKEGFGNEPLTEDVVAKFTDLLNIAGRAGNAVVGAGAGLIGDTAQNLGMSQGMAQRGKRDVMQGGQAAGAASMLPEVAPGVATTAATRLLKKPTAEAPLVTTPRGTPEGIRAAPVETRAGLPNEAKAPLPNEAKAPPPDQPRVKSIIESGDPRLRREFLSMFMPKPGMDKPANAPGPTAVPEGFIRTKDLEQPPPAKPQFNEKQLQNMIDLAKAQAPKMEANAADTRFPKETRDHYAEQARLLRLEIVNRTKELENQKGSSLTPQPQPLGAAAPTQTALPDRPTNQMINEQADRFYKIGQQHSADKIETNQRIDKMPKEIKNPQVQEKFYRYMEDPNSVQLTPQEQQIYQQHIAPMKAEERQLYERAKNFGVDDLDPNYVHRMVQGKNPAFDQFTQAGQSGDPTVTASGSKLPRSTSSMRNRIYYALDNGKGQRKVITLDRNGQMQIVENGKYTPVSPKLHQNFSEVKPGARVSVGGKDWDIVQAKTHELEANTGLKYYKSALANTADNVVRLRQVNRSLDEIKRLTESPEWGAYAAKHNDFKAPGNWYTPDVPLFRDWKMDPKVAHVIEDFYKDRYKGEGADWITKANNFMVRSLFWNPVPHLMNVGIHWAVARGWDWVTPRGMQSLVLDGAKAAREVVMQGPKFQQLMREGSAMISPSIENKAFYEKLLNKVGMDVQKNPQRWNPIIRALGMSKPADFIKAYYQGMSKALWTGGDVFMMQRVLELERKGMSTAHAIKEAEKHIPNYRIPTTVLGSRQIQQFLTNPLATEFSRYHYGIFKSYAHMVKDSIGPNATAKERFDAIGNMMVLGTMMYWVYPALDNALKNITGNKEAKLLRRGAATVPQNLIDYYGGDKGLPQLFNQIVTLAPLAREGIEQWSNLDLFTGRRIHEPGGTGLEQAGQAASHAFERGINPIQNITQGLKAQRPGESLPESVVRKAYEQAVGISNPTPEQTRGKASAKAYEAREAAKRRTKPRGALEQFLEKLTAPKTGGIQ